MMLIRDTLRNEEQKELDRQARIKKNHEEIRNKIIAMITVDEDDDKAFTVYAPVYEGDKTFKFDLYKAGFSSMQLKTVEEELSEVVDQLELKHNIRCKLSFRMPYELIVKVLQ